MPDHDDESFLEDTFRASLQRHAEGVDVRAPVSERAVAAGRRRRQSVAVMAVAAVSVAVLVLAGAWVARDAPADEGPRIADGSSEPSDLPTGWRTEYWHGLQVDVPADWGWGTAPAQSVGGATYLCGGPGAMVRANGKRLVNAEADLPWVGRPIMLSDACFGGLPENPLAPYMWIGADIAPGVEDVGNGYSQETVTVGDVTVTVASPDEKVRDAILQSARLAEGPCAAAYPEVPDAAVEDVEREDDRNVGDLVVCAYAESGGEYALTYGQVLDNGGAAFLEAAQGSAEFACRSAEEEFVVLRTAGMRFVVTFGCPGIRQPASGALLRLSEENVAPWAVNGIPATVGGPRGLPARWIYDYFIGGLG